MNRLVSHLPRYEKESKTFKMIMAAEQIEFDITNKDIKELNNQFFIDSATWGLEVYERTLGIKTDISKTLTERRGVIKSKLRGVGKVDNALIKSVADGFVNGGVEVDFNGKILIIFNDVKGIPSNLQDLERAIRNISPAHLAITYRFIYLFIKEIHEVVTLTQMEQIELNKFAGGVING